MNYLYISNSVAICTQCRKRGGGAGGVLGGQKWNRIKDIIKCNTFY